jgi:hypothetical protein
LRSRVANVINSLVPRSLHWITSPVLALLFDRKILNCDTEHIKQVHADG